MPDSSQLTAPRPLRRTDDISAFDSGKPELDRWLRERARRNEGMASRTYVVCEGTSVAAYYALAAGSVERSVLPGKIRRNMPQPVPVMILGRLAVSKLWQGQGVGRALVRDAMLRTLNAAEIAGIRAMLVHALDRDAASFYRCCGFLESMNPSILLFPLEALIGLDRTM